MRGKIVGRERIGNVEDCEVYQKEIAASRPTRKTICRKMSVLRGVHYRQDHANHEIGAGTNGRSDGRNEHLAKKAKISRERSRVIKYLSVFDGKC